MLINANSLCCTDSVQNDVYRPVDISDLMVDSVSSTTPNHLSSSVLSRNEDEHIGILTFQHIAQRNLLEQEIENYQTLRSKYITAQESDYELIRRDILKSESMQWVLKHDIKQLSKRIKILRRDMLYSEDSLPVVSIPIENSLPVVPITTEDSMHAEDNLEVSSNEVSTTSNSTIASAKIEVLNIGHLSIGKRYYQNLDFGQFIEQFADMLQCGYTPEQIRTEYSIGYSVFKYNWNHWQSHIARAAGMELSACDLVKTRTDQLNDATFDKVKDMVVFMMRSLTPFQQILETAQSQVDIHSAAFRMIFNRQRLQLLNSAGLDEDMYANKLIKRSMYAR